MDQLYNLPSENEEEYEKWILENMKNFIQMFIETSDDPKRDLKWLMNWIGGDCYDELIGKKEKSVCQERKNFLEKTFSQKQESSPFTDITQLSSTKPGMLTVQSIDHKNRNKWKAKRFDYDSKLDEDKKITIQDYINKIVKHDKKYKNYYVLSKPYDNPLSDEE
jgi:hypothetical protein